MSLGHDNLGIDAPQLGFDAEMAQAHASHLHGLRAQQLRAWSLNHGGLGASHPPTDSLVTAKVQLAAYCNALSQQLPEASDTAPGKAPADAFAPLSLSHAHVHAHAHAHAMADLSAQQLLGGGRLAATHQLQAQSLHQPHPLPHPMQHHAPPSAQLFSAGLPPPAPPEPSSLLWPGCGAAAPHEHTATSAAVAFGGVGGALSGGGGLPASSHAAGLNAYAAFLPVSTTTPPFGNGSLPAPAVHDFAHAPSHGAALRHHACGPGADDGMRTPAIPMVPNLRGPGPGEPDHLPLPAFATPAIATPVSEPDSLGQGYSRLGADAAGLALAVPMRRRVGRKPKLIPFETIAKKFDQPIARAARSLGVCATVIKKVCRDNGVQRWPYRKIQSVVRPFVRLQLRVSQGLASPNEIAELHRLTLAQQQRQPGDSGGSGGSAGGSGGSAGGSGGSDSETDPYERSVAGGEGSSGDGDSECDVQSLPVGRASPTAAQPALRAELMLPALQPLQRPPHTQPQSQPMRPPPQTQTQTQTQSQPMLPPPSAPLAPPRPPQPMADPLAQYAPVFAPSQPLSGEPGAPPAASLPADSLASLGYHPEAAGLPGQFAFLHSARLLHAQALLRQQQEQLLALQQQPRAAA